MTTPLLCRLGQHRIESVIVNLTQPGYEGVFPVLFNHCSRCHPIPRRDLREVYRVG